MPNSVATSATVAGISATLNTRFSGSVVAGVASVTSAPALRLGRFAAINYFSAMKHLLHLAPVLLGLAACQSSPTTPTAVAPVTATPAAPAPVTAVASEHIDSDSLTVNGQPHRQLTTRQLTSQLGRPDSIAKGAVECGGGLDIPMGSPNGDFWYYGKTAYEVNGSQAILASFNVSTGKFQGRLGRLLLNQRTTLEDVRHYFPQAVKAADVPATGRPGEVMSLPFIYKGTPADASLNLIFKQGRLQEVEFWYPC